MATAKEIFLEFLKPDGKPERQLVQYEALHMVLDDPVNLYVRAGMAPGNTIQDAWGTTILFPEGDPGPTPLITPETKVCPDITRWQEYVRVPDLAQNCRTGWEECARNARAKAGDERLVSVLMGTGMFEQCHFLMGFEDTLVNFYEHPREMHELIDCICDYRIESARLILDNLHPDVIFSHDDWGSKNSLFMSPETWRTFFKEPYRRFYSYIRSRGVITVHHADSYLVPIVEDMAEIGIQVWQGVLPENDIPALQARLKGRMTLMGGIGAAIDRADATEEEIASHVKAALTSYCPGGHFIPSITYGMAGTVYPHVDPIIDQEIKAYNQRLHMPARHKTPAPRRILDRPDRTASSPNTGSADAPILERVAEALRKGRQKQVTALCREALEAGIDPQAILTEGLVQGMTVLGEDFSANRAFVPEMLLAAKCMNAATEILKPHLTASGSATGRVCLGTIKGDMHDIGKNLVKIMMEGCGLEVIDLGVDISPETFVRTAQEQNCDLIACSSLLTTCMQEMRRVVELAEAEGIRDSVKIMVGGAPITQDFCDTIGADAYTPDAAQAARTAVMLLTQ